MAHKGQGRCEKDLFLDTHRDNFCYSPPQLLDQGLLCLRVVFMILRGMKSVFAYVKKGSLNGAFLVQDFKDYFIREFLPFKNSSAKRI